MADKRGSWLALAAGCKRRRIIMTRYKDKLFRQEAERLAKLPARERKEALAVHWRIADDSRLSDVTRQYARYLAETLEALVKKILQARRN
jgi:hypothetical protein